MKINMKFFLLKSINIHYKKLKYGDAEIKFNNHIEDFQNARKIWNATIEKLKLIKKELPKNFKNNIDQKKNWDIIEENQNVERALIILMKMGYNRDYIINTIFQGYKSENLNTKNEVKEKLLKANSYIIKMPISNNLLNRERLIGIVHKDIFFPLFIDSNHHLYATNYIPTSSKGKLESLLKDAIFKKFRC